MIHVLYEEYQEEVDRELWEWSMDEDQTGIPHPYLSDMTEEDFCKEVLRRFVYTRKEERS